MSENMKGLYKGAETLLSYSPPPVVNKCFLSVLQVIAFNKIYFLLVVTSVKRLFTKENLAFNKNLLLTTME